MEKEPGNRVGREGTIVVNVTAEVRQKSWSTILNSVLCKVQSHNNPSSKSQGRKKPKLTADSDSPAPQLFLIESFYLYVPL